MIEETSSLNLFIEKMKTNLELEDYGYKLILEKSNFQEYFYLLKNKGMFSFDRIPKSVGSPEGYVSPFWPALTYLIKCSDYASKASDEGLCNSITDVIQAILNRYESNENSYPSYHVARSFIEIWGYLPKCNLLATDLHSIKKFISNPYLGGLISNAIDKYLIGKYFASDSDRDQSIVVEIFELIISCEYDSEKDKFIPLIDEYWANNFLENRSHDFGRVFKENAAYVLSKQVSKVFSERKKSIPSYLCRPAIEDHEQNTFKSEYENYLITSYRECLVAWIENDDGSNSTKYVLDLLNSRLDILNRVAIYLMDKFWGKFKVEFEPMVSPDIFCDSNIHELYGLLSNHFGDMSDELKAAIFNAIMQIHPEVSLDNETNKMQRQIRWLSSIRGKGSEEVDLMFSKINETVKVPPHPSFLYYIESGWVKNNPFLDEISLLSLLAKDDLVCKLNELKELNSWDGPTIRGQVEALENVVFANPQAFIQKLEYLLALSDPYKYGLLAGLKRSWESNEPLKFDVDWSNSWPRILCFMNNVVQEKGFLKRLDSDQQWDTPDANWLPGLISDFIRSGAKNDAHGFSESDFPIALKVIETLLKNVKSNLSSHSDPMTVAINSSKGKIIEALFSFSLRASRVEHQSLGSHSGTWNLVSSLLDYEINQVPSNLEFHTLTLAYLANFEYLNFDWLSQNLLKFFPDDQEIFLASIGGLIYGQPTLKTYQLLQRENVFSRSLEVELSRIEIKKGVIERIGLGYLWKCEDLDSGIFIKIFSDNRVDVLIILAQYFWSLNRTNLDSEHINLIKLFRERCLNWAIDNQEHPNRAELLNKLANLICYMNDIDEEGERFLKNVVPHLSEDNIDYYFIQELNRLSASHPDFINKIVEIMLKKSKPLFDVGGYWLSLMTTLVNKLPAYAVHDNLISLRELNGIPNLIRSLGDS